MAIYRDSHSRIRDRARGVLRTVYAQIEEATGKRPTADEFFPVRLDSVTSSIGWRLERVPDLGWSPFGVRIMGRCVYAEKTISIAVDALSGTGEENYTVAHEIGHAVLHHQSQPCSSGASVASERKRSVRRKELTGAQPDVRRAEREADVFAYELLMPEKAVRNHFRTLFERESLWVGSPKVRAIMPRSKSRCPSLPNPADVASELATYVERKEPVGEIPSLCKFFGVSKKAMEKRLLELELVY